MFKRLFSLLALLVAITLAACGSVEVDPIAAICPQVIGTESPQETIRSLAVAETGVWMGGEGKVWHYDGQTFRFCTKTNGTVNALHYDARARALTVAVDSKVPNSGGIVQLFQNGPVDQTIHLPDYRFYEITEQQGNLYLSSYNGVGGRVNGFFGTTWQTVLGPEQLYNLHVHAIVFGKGATFTNGEVFVLHISDGVTWLVDGKKYKHLRSRYTQEADTSDDAIEKRLSGDDGRRARYNPVDGSIWMVFDGNASEQIPNDGGITVFHKGYWYYHNAENGLPNEAQDLWFSESGIPVATTMKGTYVLLPNSDRQWQQLANQPHHGLVVRTGCKGCPIDERTVLIGLQDYGLRVTTLP